MENLNLGIFRDALAESSTAKFLLVGTSRRESGKVLLITKSKSEARRVQAQTKKATVIMSVSIRKVCA